MPRFLCLPGYFQGGQVFAEKTSEFRKILTKYPGYEIDYLDPPIVIPRKECLSFSIGATEEAAEKKWKQLVARNTNRCWGDWQDGIYKLFEESYAYVVNHIKQNGPYDGIIGFSQGAAMAALVASSTHLTGLEAFKVAVLFSGYAFTVANFPVSEEEMTELFEHYAVRTTLNEKYVRLYSNRGSMKTSVITVYGTEDGVVPPVRSQFLASLYGDKSTIFVHDGGHYVPKKKQILDPIVEKIRSAVEPRPSL